MDGVLLIMGTHAGGRFSVLLPRRSGQEMGMQEKITGVARRTFAVGRMWVVAVVLVVAIGGCSTRQSPFISQQDARLNVEVINHNFQDVTVFANWLGVRRRLGTVAGTRTANYMIPWDRAIQVHFELDILASPGCITRPLWANPGDFIVLEVQSRLIALDCFR